MLRAPRRRAPSVTPLPVATRSSLRIVQSAIEIKSWAERPPSCEAVRPERCPSCGAASAPVGGRVALHGHGLRERTVLGATTRAGPAMATSVLARRYACQRCSAVVLVVPAGTLGRFRYGALAIVLALALWSHDAMSARAVRDIVSADRVRGHAVVGWPSLTRWARRAHFLWPRLPSLADALTPRAHARRIVDALAAFSFSDEGDLSARAQRGALRACS